MRQNLLVALRVAALLVLLTAAVAAATAAHPRDADYAEFARELDRGAVVQVMLPDSSSSSIDDETVWTATWSTGPFQWRRGPIADRLQTPVAEFRDAMRARGVRVKAEDGDAHLLAWPLRGPHWVTTVIGLTMLATLVAMLASRPVYGTRWAWFWMIVIGQVGALLYLVLEPAPLWRGRSGAAAAADAPEAEGAPAPRSRWNGLQGFGWSVLLLLAGAMASSGIGWLAARVPA
ncbi:hypothetical protein [Tsukamurella hominis]|uniref:hypothetical protein n=1 Tax=Tsukamurella hominis TaxID=1970232 RepID=UPI0039E82B95